MPYVCELLFPRFISYNTERFLVGEGAIEWLLKYSDNDISQSIYSPSIKSKRSGEELLVPEQYLITESSLNQWKDYTNKLYNLSQIKTESSHSKEEFLKSEKKRKVSEMINFDSKDKENNHDTVGAIVIDCYGLFSLVSSRLLKF